ncbi:MAG: ATP-binding protein [Rhodothermaceae bacterium]|nr:ATP-binding protein [Rhodothermaceae bacterium]MXZ57656.1 ATP-binding protein [Rhodothermaceae bacterium]MYB91316.1 ATP-binding protein [Rhodothermaceae bacterium]MYD68757.1 ATP-binding protein [Rhodothermaceae bacterium]MYG45411.1 ATP-binding protein [Rhodothermaceae bacterium]
MKIAEFERPHVHRIVERVSRVSHTRIVAITGPRQVGKTTIALQVRQRLLESKIPCWYIPMDGIDSGESDWSGIQETSSNIRTGSPADGQVLVEIWKRARQASLDSEQGLVLFLDEIQVVPRWSNIMKGLWDADRRREYPLRVVILGSAAWRMLIGRNESLVGRFDSIRVTHWTFQEMTRVFGLAVDEFMFLGGYPGSLSDRSGSTRLADWRDHVVDSIMAPIIDRDIMGLSRIRKPALMRQLIDLVPNYSGQVISYSKLLGQLHDAGNTTTIANYLNLLSDAGLIITLFRYTSAPHLGRASSPKLNVLNTALMTVPSGYSLQGAQVDRSFWGRVVESAVGAHLYNTRGTVTRIHFWRDKSGKHEVDFVISRGPHLVGVEVKSGNVRSRRGLEAFKDRFPKAKTMIVGPSGIPLDIFFSRTTDEWIEAL